MAGDGEAPSTIFHDLLGHTRDNVNQQYQSDEKKRQASLTYSDIRRFRAQQATPSALPAELAARLERDSAVIDTMAEVAIEDAMARNEGVNKVKVSIEAVTPAEEALQQREELGDTEDEELERAEEQGSGSHEEPSDDVSQDVLGGPMSSPLTFASRQIPNSIVSSPERHRENDFALTCFEVRADAVLASQVMAGAQCMKGISESRIQPDAAVKKVLRVAEQWKIFATRRKGG